MRSKFQELYEQFEGDNSFSVTLKWVKIYDPQVYEKIKDIIQNQEKDTMNKFEEDFMERFNDGMLYVNYRVNPNDHEEDKFTVKVSVDKIKDRNFQNAWFVDVFLEQDLEDGNIQYRIETYKNICLREYYFKMKKVKDFIEQSDIVEVLKDAGKFPVSEIPKEYRHVGWIYSFLLQNYGIEIVEDNRYLVNKDKLDMPKFSVYKK